MNEKGAITPQTRDKSQTSPHLERKVSIRRGEPMLSEANNAFACDLYRQLATENSGRNLFFSPCSLFNVLAICAEGARGATADELGNVLRFPAKLRHIERKDSENPWDLGPLRDRISTLNSLMGSDGTGEADPGQIKESRMKLWHLSKREEEAKQQGDQNAQQQIAEETRREQVRFDRLKARTDPNVIHAANSLWGEKTLPFRNEFVEVIERHYLKDGISPVDFKGNAEDAARLINDWVSRQTNGRITEIVSASSLDELTRLILVNAIYFKGEWERPFNADLTRPLDFRRTDCSARRVPMMIQTDYDEATYAAFNGDGTSFPTPHWIKRELELDPLAAIIQDPVGSPGYPDSDGFALLDIPYRAHRLSMVLLAPNRHDGLAALEERVTGDALTRWIKQLKGRQVHVVVPRFNFDTGYQFSGVFRKLGLKRAFMDPSSGDGADFRGMTISDKPDDQIFISEIFHNAFVDVNERGTEAGASSAMAMYGAALGVPRTVPFVPVFKADSPFICIIRDRPSGTILFMGRVMDPG